MTVKMRCEEEEIIQGVFLIVYHRNLQKNSSLVGRPFLKKSSSECDMVNYSRIKEYIVEMEDFGKWHKNRPPKSMHQPGGKCCPAWTVYEEMKETVDQSHVTRSLNYMEILFYDHLILYF